MRFTSSSTTNDLFIFLRKSGQGNPNVILIIRCLVRCGRLRCWQGGLICHAFSVHKPCVRGALSRSVRLNLTLSREGETIGKSNIACLPLRVLTCTGLVYSTDTPHALRCAVGRAEPSPVRSKAKNPNLTCVYRIMVDRDTDNCYLLNQKVFPPAAACSYHNVLLIDLDTEQASFE